MSQHRNNAPPEIRRERGAAAQTMVKYLLRDRTQRDLAKDLGVSQCWVYSHAHRLATVPSDAVWRKLKQYYDREIKFWAGKYAS